MFLFAAKKNYIDIVYTIHIAHKLKLPEPTKLQRWLQKFEATFESAPQCLLHFLGFTAHYSGLF